MKKIIIVSALLLILAGCSAAPVGTSHFSKNDLREQIERKFNDSLFTHAHWGVLIESLTTDEIWYEQNADKMFMPASNEKIITSASALLNLGPELISRWGN